jgi:hypothetical protein
MCTCTKRVNWELVKIYIPSVTRLFGRMFLENNRINVIAWIGGEEVVKNVGKLSESDLTDDVISWLVD